MAKYSGNRDGCSFLCWLIALLLAAPPGASPAAQQPSEGGRKISIVILEGQGAVHRTGGRARTPLVVRVEDENRRPVVGAAVRFTLPESGPGGLFANGARTVLARTDRTGQVEVRGFRANTVAGEFRIEVEASYQDTSVTSTITQINSTVTGPSRTARTAKVAAIAAAAVAGAAIAVALARSDEGPQAPSVVISAGSPTVGAPH
jgi:hypothetical protein